MSTPAAPFAPGATDGLLAAPQPATVTRRWFPTSVLLLLAAGCLVAAVPMYRHGISPHVFPSDLPTDPAYVVNRYSAPWIGGSIALGGLALVLVIVAIGILVNTRPGEVQLTGALLYPPLPYQPTAGGDDD